MDSARNYFPGGFHPIHLGDVFKHGRYTIIHKLGCGSFSTVWLAKDSTTETYVSLKVLAADALARSPRSLQGISEELQILFRLRDATDEPGKECIIRLLDDFIHIGPNGKHQCIVTELLGPDLYSVIVEEDETGISLSTLSRAIIRQLTYATRFLHRNKVVHRDLHSGNILLAFLVLPSVIEEVIARSCGEVYKGEVQHGMNGIGESPHVPKYIVDVLDPLPLLQLCLSDPANVRIKICDFSAASIITEATQPKMPNSPLVFRAPEVILCKSSVPTMSTEIWALAVLFYFVASDGRDLFGAGFLHRSDAHTVMKSIVMKLGKLPDLIWLAWTKRAEFFDMNGQPLDEGIKETPMFFALETLMDDEERVLFEEVMGRMLMVEPTKRATIDEVIESEWFLRYCNDSHITS